MSSICPQCSFGIYTAVRTSTRPALRRAFSQCPARRRSGIPKFHETSVAELDDVLNTMREKHFNFGYLPRREQRLLLNPANRQALEDNPRTARVGQEELELKWVDRRTDVTPIRTLFRRAIELMATSEDGRAFRELPALLIGLNGMKKPLHPDQIEKVVRKAVENGRAGAILECIEQAERSGLRATAPEVYEPFVTGIRAWVQEQGWSREATSKGLKDVKQLARLMEAEVESEAKGRMMGNQSPLHDPRLLGIFLELAAVHARVKYDGKDLDGLVEMYTRGLLQNMSDKDLPQTTTPRQRGQQVEVLFGVPILRGLRLSRSILSSQATPAADQMSTQLETILSQIIATIEAEQPSPGTYKSQAIDMWKSYKDGSL